MGDKDLLVMFEELEAISHKKDIIIDSLVEAYAHSSRGELNLANKRFAEAIKQLDELS